MINKEFLNAFVITIVVFILVWFSVYTGRVAKENWIITGCAVQLECNRLTIGQLEQAVKERTEILKLEDTRKRLLSTIKEM